MGWTEMHLVDKRPHRTDAPSRTASGCQKDVYLGVQLATIKEHDVTEILVYLAPRPINHRH